jgi:hypothetical protein
MKEINERVSDGILIAHILVSLPKEYDNVADQLELNQKYERMKSVGEIYVLTKSRIKFPW